MRFLEDLLEEVTLGDKDGLFGHLRLLCNIAILMRIKCAFSAIVALTERIDGNRWWRINHVWFPHRHLKLLRSAFKAFGIVGNRRIEQ